MWNHFGPIVDALFNEKKMRLHERIDLVAWQVRRGNHEAWDMDFFGRFGCGHSHGRVRDRG